MDYDVLVIGGGIAGMESALVIGDMGYSVLLVEKGPSIGGKMILLSKVFPTLDCASCIGTPKMAATFHHPQVETLTYTEVQDIRKTPEGKFQVGLKKKATYTNFDQCTGCQKCEFACTVAIPDQFNFELIARRAAYIPFPQAIPKKAIIDRQGTSPCSHTCPAGMKAHGYVSLIRSGLFDEALELVLESAPLAGTLGRICYAPCEKACTRGDLEGAVPIRKLKRFAADHYYDKHPRPEFDAAEQNYTERVAIVGSGPAGLTAAYHLARRGYPVTLFESRDKLGGMLRLIPSFTLPEEVIDRDIMNVTSLGVEVRTGHPVKEPWELKNEGFGAVFFACGASGDIMPEMDGADLTGVTGAIAFLKEVSSGERPDLAGKTVAVIGAGRYIIAVDCARTAIRLGATRVVVQFERNRNELSDIEWAVQDALEEGVEFRFLKGLVRLSGKNEKLTHIETVEMAPGGRDHSGRIAPGKSKGTVETMNADLAILAIGQEPDMAFGEREVRLRITPFQTLEVDPVTLQTGVPGLFAGGDIVSGPATVVEAVNSGIRAARSIHRFLRGEKISQKEREKVLPAVERKKVIERQDHYKTMPPLERDNRPAVERKADFNEVELPLDDEAARRDAVRCLDCGGCSECHQCISACPADAIDFDMQDVEESFEVGSVVVSTGIRLFDPVQKRQYGYDRFPNVITSMQMDRILAPTRPYNTVLRPSDGKMPDNIAYILCTGSRDCQVDNPLCSRVCCMYSIKQAQLIMGSLPLADVTIYYIDVRAFGKGFEEFYQEAKAMGVYFVKGKVARVDGAENGNLIVHYENISGEGKIAQAEHDLVVLSVGLLPNLDPLSLFSSGKLDADQHNYVKEIDEDHTPARTSIEGVYVAGSASAAMDIPDTILHAGAAASMAAAYVERVKR